MDYFNHSLGSSIQTSSDVESQTDALDEEDCEEPPLPKPRLIPRFPSQLPLHSILLRSGSRSSSLITLPAISRCSSHSSSASKGVRFATTEIEVNPTHSPQAYDRAPYRECVSLEIPQCSTSQETWYKCASDRSSAYKTFYPYTHSPDDFDLSLPPPLTDDSSGSESDDLISPITGINGLGLDHIPLPSLLSLPSSTKEDGFFIPSFKGEEDDDDTAIHERYGICPLNSKWSNASIFTSCDALGGF